MPIVIAVVLLLGSSVLGAAVGYPLLVPLVMVIATTVWVHSDSDEIDYPDSAIEAKVLLFWIVYFPFYLYRRRELKLANAVSQRLSEEKVTNIRMSNSNSPTTHGATTGPSERACPECGETVLAVARKCKHCGSAIEPIATEAAAEALTVETSTGSAQPSPTAASVPMGARLGRSTESLDDEVEDKSSRRIYIGVAVAVLALGALVWFGANYKGTDLLAGGGSGGADTTPQYAVGQLATTPKFGILVTEVEMPSSVGNVLIHTEPAEGGKYVAVQWEYQNNSSKPIGSFGQPTLYLEDASGTRYEADLDASSSYAMGLELTEKILSDLNPGIKVRSASVFEVAASHLDLPGWMIVIDADSTVKMPLFGKPGPVAAEAPAPVENSPAVDTSGTAPPASLPALGDMLGVTVAFLDNKIGPAKHVENVGGVDLRTYEIGNCTLVTYVTGGTVQSIELPVADEGCTVSMSDVFGDNTNNVLEGPVRAGMHLYTFGELLQFASAWAADEACLQGCGNASEPVYGLVMELPRVYGSKQLHLQVYYNDSAGVASDRLRESLLAAHPELSEENGDLWGEYVEKIGQEAYNTAWFQAFKDVKVGSLRVGDGMVE